MYGMNEDFEVDGIRESFIDNYLSCKLCLELSNGLKQCNTCEYMACSKCVEKYNLSSKCVNCYKNVEYINLNRNLGNIINEMKMKCKYFEKGCRVKLTYETRDKHVDICEFANVEVIPKMSCEFCKVEFSLKNFEKHISNKKECFPKLVNDLQNSHSNEVNTLENEKKLFLEKIESLEKLTKE